MNSSPATHTVYVGKGRYGVNHNGQAIAFIDYTGQDKYSVTILDADGNELRTIESVNKGAAELTAVTHWNILTPKAVTYVPATIEADSLEGNEITRAINAIATAAVSAIRAIVPSNLGAYYEVTVKHHGLSNLHTWLVAPAPTDENRNAWRLL